MNKKSFEGAYQAPELSIIDINAEGVLCQSGEMTINAWTYDPNEQINGAWN